MNYYVYLYLRKDLYSPYYVGKGTGSRCFVQHKRVGKPRDKERIRKVFTTNCEEEAVEVEATLIKFYGRIQDGGVLLNKAQRGRKRGTLTKQQRIRVAKKRNTGVELEGWESSTSGT